MGRWGGEFVKVLQDRYALRAEHGEDVGPMPVLNADLLRHLIEWAEKSHENQKQVESGFWNAEVQINGYKEGRKPLVRRWDQGTWHCGTGCCIAGAAGIAAGAKYDPAEDHEPVFKGQTMSWSDLGAEVLGLMPDEADVLFRASNDLDDIRMIAETIATSRGVTLFKEAKA